jgi:hypothetical protein
VELPLGFWFSEQISSALAVWDWATVLQAVWQEVHPTQVAIAAQTGLSQTTVSRLMAGRSGGQNIETTLKLLDGLGAPRQLAGLMPKGLGHITGEDTRSGEPQVSGKGSDVRRREFGQKVLLAGLTIPLAGVRSSESTVGAVDVVTGLEQPSDVIADLWALDAVYGGAALADMAENRMASVTRQLKLVTIKPSDEPLVQAMLGHIATAGSWFAAEGGDLARAKRLLKEALFSVHGTGNTALRLHVINNMAMNSRALGDSAKSVAISLEALESAPHADPRLKALLAMRCALGYADVGNDTGYDKMRGLAWDYLGKSNGPARDEWFKFFGEPEMHGLNGIGQAKLGHHAAMVSLESETLQAMGPRNRAYYQVLRATSLVKSGEHTRGIDAFHESLPLLLEVTSSRVADNVRDFVAALQPVPGPNVDQARQIALTLIGGSHV